MNRTWQKLQSSVKFLQTRSLLMEIAGFWLNPGPKTEQKHGEQMRFLRPGDLVCEFPIVLMVQKFGDQQPPFWMVLKP